MIFGSASRALLARVAAEHRRPLLAIALIAAVGAVGYFFVVSPLSERVANIEERDRAAEQALAAAQAELAAATGTLTGKARAATELAAFYKDVLPQDLSGARRLTYLRLARLARETNLEYDRASYTPTTTNDSTLTRLEIQLSLSGSYADVRRFIYELEAAPEFIVIDNVQLSEGGDEAGALAVTLTLSTYYQGRVAS
jgi:Tfp pilus assembly protein PilO